MLHAGQGMAERTTECDQTAGAISTNARADPAKAFDWYFVLVYVLEFAPCLSRVMCKVSLTTDRILLSCECEFLRTEGHSSGHCTQITSSLGYTGVPGVHIRVFTVGLSLTL